MPSFSIVIPVYDGEVRLHECLDSLCGQTLDDIEIVCVDDCGHDDSRAILDEYAHVDARVHILTQPENHGSARARRRGVIESTGDFLMFCDQDDTLRPDACGLLFGELRTDPVDILQYDTSVVNDGGVDQSEIDGLAAWLKPYGEPLHGREIVDACFAQHRFGYTIWNKAYEGTVARTAFSATEDVSVPLGEDNYASFALTYFANSYRGLPDEKLYRYHYGRGYTGHGTQSAASFERTIGLATADSLIRDFLESRNAFEDYRDTYETARYHLLAYVIDRWNSEVDPTDRQATLKSIVRHWGYRDVFTVMSHHNRRNLPLLLRCRKG